MNTLCQCYCSLLSKSRIYHRRGCCWHEEAWSCLGWRMLIWGFVSVFRSRCLAGRTFEYSTQTGANRFLIRGGLVITGSVVRQWDSSHRDWRVDGFGSRMEEKGDPLWLWWTEGIFVGTWDGECNGGCSQGRRRKRAGEAIPAVRSRASTAKPGMNIEWIRMQILQDIKNVNTALIEWGALLFQSFGLLNQQTIPCLGKSLSLVRGTAWMRRLLYSKAQ